MVVQSGFSTASTAAGDLCHFRPVPPVKTGKITGGVPDRREVAVENFLQACPPIGFREGFDPQVERMLS
jgi:hypothetical protein